MKIFKYLEILAFVINMTGAYFLVNDWITFMILTGIILFNYLEGIAKGKNI